MLIFHDHNLSDVAKCGVFIAETLMLMLGSVLLIFLIAFLCNAVSRCIAGKKEKAPQKAPSERANNEGVYYTDMISVASSIPYTCRWRNGKVIAIETHNYTSWKSGAQDAPAQSALRQRFGLPDNGHTPLSEAEIQNGAAITPITCTSFSSNPSLHLHLRMYFPSIMEHVNSFGVVDYKGLEDKMTQAFIALFKAIRAVDSICDRTLLLPIPEHEALPEDRQRYCNAYVNALLSAIARFFSSGSTLSLPQLLGMKEVLIFCYDSDGERMLSNAFRASRLPCFGQNSALQNVWASQSGMSQTALAQ